MSTMTRTRTRVKLLLECWCLVSGVFGSFLHTYHYSDELNKAELVSDTYMYTTNTVHTGNTTVHLYCPSTVHLTYDLRDA